MLTVAKFGGSSLASGDCWKRAAQIIRADIARRVVVVSACGKRHPDDHKITDLLYLCHAHLRCGVPCWELWQKIARRYIAIRDECAIVCPIEEELQAIYAALSSQTEADALVSRGEYLSAKLMAAYLGYSFVDAKDWLQFDYAGNVREEASYAALSSLADGRKIVTPGFYGALPDGRIHTFSRGGSDITGSLAAAALRADVYENWTDVPGVLAADPRIIDAPAPISHLSYEELQLLSAAGAQVLHEEAVAPVRARGIALHIRSSFQPELPGTRIAPGKTEKAPGIHACFAGRRAVSMLRVRSEKALDENTLPSVLACLRRHKLTAFHLTLGCEELCLLLRAGPGAQALHAACQELKNLLGGLSVQLRENLSVIFALFPAGKVLPRLAAAMEDAGVPIHHLASTPPGALLCVNDSQYAHALRAAYAAANL